MANLGGILFFVGLSTAFFWGSAKIDAPFKDTVCGYILIWIILGGMFLLDSQGSKRRRP